MSQLFGKTAIITGGASGIGRATALLFTRSGVSVAIADLDEAAGNEICKKIQEEGGKAIFIHCDVSQASDCQRLVQKVIDTWERIDILFNNAGIIRRADVIDTTEEEWDRVMAVNVKSIFLMSKYVIPYMIQAGGGSVINTSSGWGLVGGRKAASYCASKGAVVNLTRAMALDYSPMNVRVNCICPGDTDTGMLRNEARQLGESEINFLTSSADRPLGRIGTPEEIAQPVLFLASSASSFITGTALVVDGGKLAG